MMNICELKVDLLDSFTLSKFCEEEKKAEENEARCYSHPDMDYDVNFESEQLAKTRVEEKIKES
jgi:hypothetical protein